VAKGSSKGGELTRPGKAKEQTRRIRSTVRPKFVNRKKDKTGVTVGTERTRKALCLEGPMCSTYVSHSSKEKKDEGTNSAKREKSKSNQSHPSKNQLARSP